MLVIAIVLIVIVGPKDLPKMLRTFGKTTSGLRKMAGDFRRQFDEALKEAELDDVRQLANDVKGLNPLGKLGEDLNADLRKAAKDIDDATKPSSAADSALAASGDKMKAAQADAGKPKVAAKTAAAKAKAPAKKAATAKTTTKPATAKTASRSASAKTAAKPATAKSEAAKSAAKPAASKSTAAKSAAKSTTAGAAKSKAAPKSRPAAKTAAAKTAKSKSSGDKS